MKANNNRDIRSCKQCGKMYVYNGFGEPLCEVCKERDIEEFESVKKYIYENLDATIRDTAEATGVKVRRITAYIRESRLLIPDKSAVFIPCEICSESITSGRVCKKCATTMSVETKSQMGIELHHVGEKPNRDASKMHFVSMQIERTNRRSYGTH